MLTAELTPLKATPCKGDTTMTPRTDLANSTTMVVGASRGLGRGIAAAFAEAGAPVIAVARSETALNDLARAASGIRPEVADAGDPSIAGSLIDRYDPTLWFESPELLRSTGRSSTTPRRRSRPTGTPTCGSRFTGCARRCLNPCGPEAA